MGTKIKRSKKRKQNKTKKPIKELFQEQYNEPALHAIERLGKEVPLLTD